MIEGMIDMNRVVCVGGGREGHCMIMIHHDGIEEVEEVVEVEGV